MASGDPEARELRLRRMAGRQGLYLEKSRRRDRYATEYNKWRIRDISTGIAATAAGREGRYDLTLDQVEEWLTWQVPREGPSQAQPQLESN